MVNNRIRIVTVHSRDVVEMHPPSRGSVDLGRFSVKRYLLRSRWDERRLTEGASTSRASFCSSTPCEDRQPVFQHLGREVPDEGVEVLPD